MCWNRLKQSHLGFNLRSTLKLDLDLTPSCTYHTCMHKMLFEATSIVQRSNLHFIGEKVRGGRMLFACCGCIVAALLYKLLYCGWQTDLTLLRHGVVFTTVVNRLRCKVGLIAVHRKLHPFCARFCMVGFSRIHYIAMYCIVCAAMQCGLDSRVKPLRH